MNNIFLSILHLAEGRETKYKKTGCKYSYVESYGSHNIRSENACTRTPLGVCVTGITDQYNVGGSRVELSTTSQGSGTLMTSL